MTPTAAERRLNATIDELNRVKAAAVTMAAELAILKRVTPYVVLLDAGYLPQPADRAETDR